MTLGERIVIAFQNLALAGMFLYLVSEMNWNPWWMVIPGLLWTNIGISNNERNN